MYTVIMIINMLIAKSNFNGKRSAVLRRLYRLLADCARDLVNSRIDVSLEIKLFCNYVNWARC